MFYCCFLGLLLTLCRDGVWQGKAAHEQPTATLGARATLAARLYLPTPPFWLRKFSFRMPISIISWRHPSLRSSPFRGFKVPNVGAFSVETSLRIRREGLLVCNVPRLQCYGLPTRLCSDAARPRVMAPSRRLRLIGHIMSP